MATSISASEEVRTSVTFTNRHSETIAFYVEPWGNVYQLLPEECIRVDIIAPTTRPIDISYRSNSVTVEGWEGSHAEVWLEGNRVG